jgi:hypothetical protein
MCSAKVFLLASILKFGGNLAELPCGIREKLVSVDRLRKTAILAAEMKYRGERGIHSQQIRKAP